MIHPNVVCTELVISTYRPYAYIENKSNCLVLIFKKLVIPPLENQYFSDAQKKILYA